MAGYYISEQQYGIPVSVNVGILVTFAGIYIKAHSALADLGTKIQQFLGLFGGMGAARGARAGKQASEAAASAIGLGMGAYFLLFGVLIAIVASAACEIHLKKEPVNLGSIGKEIKNAFLGPVTIAGQKLPSFVLAIIVVLLLIFIAMNIEFFGVKVSSLM